MADKVRKSKRKSVFIHIGDFEIKSGIVCSDPCYGYGANYAYIVKGGVSGKWSGYVAVNMTRKYGYNVSSITFVREGSRLKEASQEMLFDDIGVDSGCCGFFDEDYYRNSHSPENKESWYDKYVLDSPYENSANPTGDKGFWSRTAYGDGTYALYADYSHSKGKTEIVRLTVLYDWVKPDIIGIYESEGEAKFPYSSYNSINKMAKYMKLFPKGERVNAGKFESCPEGWMSYEVLLDKPVKCRTRTCKGNADEGWTVFVDRLSHSGEAGDTDVSGKDEYGDSSMFYSFRQLDDKSQKKVVKALEKQFKVDKKKLFF